MNDIELQVNFKLLTDKQINMLGQYMKNVGISDYNITNCRNTTKLKYQLDSRDVDAEEVIESNKNFFTKNLLPYKKTDLIYKKVYY